jgi:single-strand DNA-binding protein
MTANVNRTHLTGNLGSDPESRFSATGTLIVTASIAVHSSYKQGDAWKERTDWFRLVAFGEAGEALGRFGKGERIQVTGRLQSSEYTDREGQRRTSVEVVVLRSEPAPLARKAAAEAEAEPEAEVEVEAEAEPAAEAPQPTPRRRRKVAA